MSKKAKIKKSVRGIEMVSLAAALDMVRKGDRVLITPDRPGLPLSSGVVLKIDRKGNSSAGDPGPSVEVRFDGHGDELWCEMAECYPDNRTDVERDPIGFIAFWLNKNFKPKDCINSDVHKVRQISTGMVFQLKDIPDRAFQITVQEAHVN